MSTTATLQQQQKAFSENVQQYIEQLQKDLESNNVNDRKKALKEVQDSLMKTRVTTTKGSLRKKIVSWE